MTPLDEIAPAKKLPYPRLMKPRLLQDGFLWLRVFHARYDRIEAPFYGVNIWRVKRKKMAASIAHLIKLGAPGLNPFYGKVHAIETVPVDGDDDLADVVLIYDWHSLPHPSETEDAAPLSVLPAHFSFMGSVQAYNWNLVKEVKADPAVYATMLTHHFHEDICEPPV